MNKNELKQLLRDYQNLCDNVLEDDRSNLEEVIEYFSFNYNGFKPTDKESD